MKRIRAAMFALLVGLTFVAAGSHNDRIECEVNRDDDCFIFCGDSDDDFEIDDDGFDFDD